jgi:hypothetical protein
MSTETLVLWLLVAAVAVNTVSVLLLIGRIEELGRRL